MNTTEIVGQLTVDTFTEHRHSDGPRPALHPVWRPEEWATLRRKYDQRRRTGHGDTELPNSSNREGISVYFAFETGTDRLLIVVDHAMLAQNRISIREAWVGIHQTSNNKTVWLPLDDDDLNLR